MGVVYFGRLFFIDLLIIRLEVRIPSRARDKPFGAFHTGGLFFFNYLIVYPPSTTRSAPLIMSAPSEDRKITAAATSSGSANLPTGI